MLPNIRTRTQSASTFTAINSANKSAKHATSPSGASKYATGPVQGLIGSPKSAKHLDERRTKVAHTKAVESPGNKSATPQQLSKRRLQALISDDESDSKDTVTQTAELENMVRILGKIIVRSIECSKRLDAALNLLSKYAKKLRYHYKSVLPLLQALMDADPKQLPKEVDDKIYILQGDGLLNLQKTAEDVKSAFNSAVTIQHDGVMNLDELTDWRVTNHEGPHLSTPDRTQSASGERERLPRVTGPSGDRPESYPFYYSCKRLQSQHYDSEPGPSHDMSPSSVH
ncbi:MAG: hypothetical protein Q9174_002072 [Haloplaca sp. 1 TL-2023]